MTKPLLIVESPAKAKTISKYLDDKYIVKASIGHIRDLPKSNKNAIDIEKGFVPHYEISPDKKKVITELKKYAQNAPEIILATDPDREGEAIAWHVAEVLGLKPDGHKVKRITFNEITKEAIQEALAHPRTIDQNLLKAQEARRVLDRLVGYDLSGLIWKKVRYGLSAGRVQSPALRIIMEREREIKAFQPEDYWVITAEVKKDRDQFTLTCLEEPRDKNLVDKIVKIGQKEKWQVKEVIEQETLRKARAPFKTSTLQQAASTQLGFTPSRTMRVAQKLYEAGLITYMRTDSTNLAQSAQKQILKLVKEKFGQKYAQANTFVTKSKTAQEAHEAIRPTNITKEVAGINEEQKKLYNLIWRRTVSSQMAPVKMLKTKIIVQVGSGQIPNFAINGSRIISPGWYLADPQAKGEEKIIPQLKKNDVLDLIEIKTEAKQTQPPNRYSEAGLIKELEKRGIGRPSTYATIIKTLEDRGYVQKINKALHPTDTGEVVSTFLEKNFNKYISDTFTAEMENELDEIATGKRDYITTLQEFYTPFHQEVEAKQDIEKLTNLGDAPKEFTCPKCNQPMVIKLGKQGKFLSCSNYPTCEGSRTLEGKEVGAPDSLGKDPQTGENIYLMEGPYGPYVQLGEKTKDNKKPRRASIPKDKKPEEVTLNDALKYLSLPKELGLHPKTGKPIIANIGRFGPYISHDGEFRSLKEDDVYTIDLKRALEILAEEKKLPPGTEKIKSLGKHPKTNREILLLKNKSGYFIKKGRRNIYLDDNQDPNKFTLDDALKILK